MSFGLGNPCNRTIRYDRDEGVRKNWYRYGCQHSCDCGGRVLRAVPKNASWDSEDPGNLPISRTSIDFSALLL